VISIAIKSMTCNANFKLYADRIGSCRLFAGCTPVNTYLGAFTVTCACSAPERRNRLTADQPVSLSQRITKRMPRSHSSETNQAAG